MYSLKAHGRRAGNVVGIIGAAPDELGDEASELDLGTGDVGLRGIEFSLGKVGDHPGG